MQRRKFLIGAGALAAGSAAAMGTGAFSAMSADRDADIDVVSDSEGLVTLRAGPDPSVFQDGAGELAIDLSPGINVDSRYQIGYPKNILGGDFGDALVADAPDGQPFPEYELSEAAFQVVNEDTVDHEVALTYEATDPGDSIIWFEPVPSNGTSGNADVIEVTGGSNPDSMPGKTVNPGELLGVTILIDTRDGSTSDDLSGTLTVSAE